MFFSKKPDLSINEKIHIVHTFMTTDITVKQQAKAYNIAAKELESWYQVYKYGIQQSLDEQPKPKIIPLVSNASDLPVDTFILFLNSDCSSDVKKFISLFSNESEALQFASGRGAMIGQGDEAVLISMKEMVKSLCGYLNDEQIILTQIKNISIKNRC